jgi:hypothetical protein
VFYERNTQSEAALLHFPLPNIPDNSGKISNKLFYPTVLILIQRPFAGRVLCHVIIEYLASSGRRYLFRNNEHGATCFQVTNFRLELVFHLKNNYSANQTVDHALITVPLHYIMLPISN